MYYLWLGWDYSTELLNCAPVSLQDEPDSVATPVVPADSSVVSDSTAQTAPATIVLQ